ncbi:MAG: hypothetical protein JW837_18005, partial [Sedimentisphaerales bacterium]|nr:hypothetical protein [Sedimentisphaerales bacterium]
MNKLLIILILSVLFICFIFTEVTYGAEVSLVINEFMASNGSSIQDLQGQFGDWIEIHNYGPAPVNLAGMYLTDNLSIEN